MERFIAALFRAMGADHDVAAEVARHLVRSILSGHDSHGTIRVAHYRNQINREELVPSARPKGERLPPGCIIDKEGRPTTDPEDFYAGGALCLPGGDLAAHKGYGLSMRSALISGLSMIDDPAPNLVGAPILPDAGPRGRRAPDVTLRRSAGSTG